MPLAWLQCTLLPRLHIQLLLCVLLLLSLALTRAGREVPITHCAILIYQHLLQPPSPAPYISYTLDSVLPWPKPNHPSGW